MGLTQRLTDPPGGPKRAAFMHQEMLVSGKDVVVECAMV